MTKNKIYTIVFFILALGFLAGNFVYPGLLKLNFLPDLPFRLGLDLQGGTHLVYEADLSNIEAAEHRSSMQGLRDVIERRVNLFGVEEPVVQIQERGDDFRLIVELAGVKDPAEAIAMIGETPYLVFKEQRDEEETEMILQKQAEMEDWEWEEIIDTEDWQLMYEDPYFKPTILTGRYLKKAELGFDQTTFAPLIMIEFDSEGSDLFEELTEKNINRPLAIYIDDILISAPVVQSKISGGQAQITGQFTVEEARSLARNLSAGALPVPINLISQQTVGPTLGSISLAQSLRAGIFGLLAIIIFMIFFYRLPGLLASLSLLIYVAILLSLFKLIPVTLTLAGIAGFILSIGMAVDANILIFSRMKEELKQEKNLSNAVENGFNRAWSSIRDGNLTTLLVAGILFFFGTSFIKGFAVTLSLGIILSIISAAYITRNFLRSFTNTKLEQIKWLW